jgi:hypothetical protein
MPSKSKTIPADAIPGGTQTESKLLPWSPPTLRRLATTGAEGTSGFAADNTETPS